MYPAIGRHLVAEKRHGYISCDVHWKVNKMLAVSPLRIYRLSNVKSDISLTNNQFRWCQM